MKHPSGSIRILKNCGTILRASALALPFLLSPLASAQIFNQHDTARPQDMPTETVAVEMKGRGKVTVQMDKPRTFMAPRAMAVNASVADSHLTDPEVPALLR